MTAMIAPTETEAAQPTPLTAADRCDRCGAQAYVRVELTGDRELLFCAHHGKQHELPLKKIAVNYHDETARLTE